MLRARGPPCCSSSSSAAASSGRSSSIISAHPLPHQQPPPNPPAAAALAAAALAFLAAAAAPVDAALAAPTPSNSPLVEARTKLLFGPTPDGSIRPCQGNINPNCVSTASTTDLYSPPWRAPLAVAEAARVLQRSVPAAEPSARLVQSEDDVAGTGAAYRAWQVDGLFGPDIFEVVVKPEGRGGAAAVERGVSEAGEGGPGGAGASALVTYRSSSTQVKYVYPFQIAVGDGGAQRKRSTAVRAASNFQLIGCSDIECFIE